jgi:hypothetical protein
VSCPNCGRIRPDAAPYCPHCHWWTEPVPHRWDELRDAVDDEVEDEWRRFRASIFRLGVLCAFGAGYLLGVLAISLRLPTFALLPLFAAGLMWALFRTRRGQR